MSAPFSARSIGRIALVGVLVAGLPACNTFEKLSDIGGGPQLAKIEDPQAKPGYQPVSMPMPTPVQSQRNPNSLWRTGSRAFLRDQRAAQVGDLLTVFISIGDSADLANDTVTKRGDPTASTTYNTEVMNAPALPAHLGKVLNSLLSMSGGMGSASRYTGDATITRHETVKLQLAAVVTQTLPNGNLVIQGKQQVKVNTELRELTISGIVRPEDIDSSNQISYEKIAEARIAYGGRGRGSDMQEPRYGQELFDAILPF